MKKILIILIIIFFSINLCFSQTKVELINTLIDNNEVQLDYHNMSNEFGKLLDIITESELNELTEHKNPIISTYAKVESIDKGKGNVINFLNEELKRNLTITVFDACTGEYMTTASVIYQQYFLKNKFDTIRYLEKMNIKIEDPEIDSLVSSTKIFNKLDSLVIYSNCNIHYRFLNKVFDKKYSKKYIPQIEKLAFELNIPHAFHYLRHNYKNEYILKEYNYFTKKFPTVKFKSKNEIMNLIFYLNYLMIVDNKELKKIGIARLKRKEWENHEFEFLVQNLIEEENIKL